MKKEEWIKSQTTGKFVKANKQVIKFIANFLYSNESISDGVYELFASKYCYYFAVILKEAFDRGDICWHRNHGHIVWRDINGIAYDIGGVFYDYEIGDLLPVEDSLCDMIVDFKHNGEKYERCPIRFKEWCDYYKMTELFALSDIYRNMPAEEIDDCKSVSNNAIDYWYMHKHELSEKYAERKHDMNVRKQGG